MSPAPVETYLTTSPEQREFVRLFFPPTSLQLDKSYHREKNSNDIGMLTSAMESHDQAADASSDFNRNDENGALEVEEVDDLPQVFPNSLIHLQNVDIHPDLIVEAIPLRGNVRVESRIVSSRTTTTVMNPVAVDESRLQRPEHHHQPLKIGAIEFSELLCFFFTALFSLEISWIDCFHRVPNLSTCMYYLPDPDRIIVCSFGKAPYFHVTRNHQNNSLKLMTN